MEFINMERLQAGKAQIKADWNRKTPFRYLYLDDFFYPEKAEALLAAYPEPGDEEWDHTTYINQKNKYQRTTFEPGSVLQRAFDELNSRAFLDFMTELTGIEEPLQADPKLFGGGLHQSVNGAFLDVHVDYNIHPETKMHRRLNILVYMNKNWKEAYEGHLELWDMDNNEQLERIAPLFNRMAMFETNQISYHGHPKPLKTPAGVSRKSLAAYYYTHERPANELAPEHNTKYVNTEGVQGQVKNLKSGVKALFERVKK